MSNSDSSSSSNLLTPIALATHSSPRVRQLYLSLQKFLDSAFAPAFCSELADSLGKLTTGAIPDHEAFKLTFLAALRELRNNIELEFGVILSESGFVEQFSSVDRILLEQKILQSLSEGLNQRLTPEMFELDPRKAILEDLQESKRSEVSRILAEAEKLEKENLKLNENLIKQRNQVEELMKIVNKEKENSMKLNEIAGKWNSAI